MSSEVAMVHSSVSCDSVPAFRVTVSLGPTCALLLGGVAALRIIFVDHVSTMGVLRVDVYHRWFRFPAITATMFYSWTLLDVLFAQRVCPHSGSYCLYFRS